MANNDLDRIYAEMDKQLYNACLETGKQIKKGWKEKIMDEIYNAYYPRVYSRQMALYNSIDFVVIKKDLCKYEIILSTRDELHKYNETWNEEMANITGLHNTTYAEILSRFETDGQYQVFERDEPAYPTKHTYEEYVENKKADKIIIDYLHSKGF